MVVWIIGLSGAGKTTLASKVTELVRKSTKNVVLIDGDIVREIFGNDLGHSLEDRLTNARRICQMGKFLDDQGIHVVCAILSLFPDTREWNRNNLKNYFEVFIDAPVDELIKRDSKGIYSKFRNNELQNVAGMDLEFQRPTSADMVIDNTRSREELLMNAEIIAGKIIGFDK